MQAKTAPADGFDALFAVMRMVCEDVHALALEIAGLGERLSETPSDPVAMQAFDALSQRALAQSRLLGGLERALREEEAAWRPDIDALIAAVPFHADRVRLRSVLRPVQPPDAAAAPGGGIDWF